MKKFLKKKKVLYSLIVLVVLIVSSVVLAVALPSKPTPKHVALEQITKEISSPTANKKIDKVAIEDAHRTVTIIYKDKVKTPKESSYTTDYGTTIIELADKNSVKVEVENEFGGGGFLEILMSILPFVLIVGLLIFLLVFSGVGGGMTTPISEIPETRFKDLAGVDEAVEDLGEITDFLKKTDNFGAIGAHAPKGALMSGEPGTGKTMLARAVAGEAGVPFFHVSGADFVEMFVGLGARRVRQLFKAANKHKSAIIFIDEIDAIGSKRENSSSSDSREHNRTINALLTEMDGFEQTNVIVIAATNSPESLDTALTRAGRFDRKVIVALPDWKGRLGILKIHSDGKPIADDVDLHVIAKTTTGLSGADLANLINEALINAVRRGEDKATHSDFMEALSVVTIGRARNSAVVTEQDKKITAIHESGHAVVALALEEVPDPSHVSILPRGNSGGHTKTQESEDQFRSSKELRGQLVMMMGGLAAEQKMFDDITQGPGADLQAATDLAQKMVSKMGMGNTFSVIADQSIVVNAGVNSVVREQVETLIIDAIDRAKEVLEDEKWSGIFNEMWTELLEYDTLESSDIQKMKKDFLKS